MKDKKWSKTLREYFTQSVPEELPKSPDTKIISQEPEIVKCICCEKEIEISDWEALNEGSFVTISSCYGSRFDMNIYSGHICDDCLEKKIDDGVVKFKKVKFFKVLTSKAF